MLESAIGFANQDRHPHHHPDGHFQLYGDSGACLQLVEVQKKPEQGKDTRG